MAARNNIIKNDRTPVPERIPNMAQCYASRHNFIMFFDKAEVKKAAKRKQQTKQILDVRALQSRPCLDLFEPTKYDLSGTRGVGRSR